MGRVAGHKNPTAIRALPRRRKESSHGDKTESLFLTKTHEMITSCNPAIACWTEEGDSFVVKDVDAFTLDVIPKYFKRQKFASFVRQLNFYGMRKIRGAASGDSASFQHFAHPKFRKGKPELLIEIKRSTHLHGSSASGTEVSLLREEVGNLKAQIASMEEHVENLTKMMEAVVARQFERSSTTLSSSPQSRLPSPSWRPSNSTKLEEGEEEDLAVDMCDDTSLDSFPLDIFMESDDDLFLESIDDSGEAVTESSPKEKSLSEIQRSMVGRLDSMAPLAQERLAQGLIRAVDCDPVAKAALGNAGGLLPPIAPEIALPLASAALGAFLTHFSRNQCSSASDDFMNDWVHVIPKTTTTVRTTSG